MSSADLTTSSEPVLPTQQDDVLGLSLEGLSTSSPSGGRKKGSKGKSKAKAGVEGLGVDGAMEIAGTERVSFVSPAAVSASGAMKGA